VSPIFRASSINLFHSTSIQIPAGKVVAFVGPSGAGKSTLFNLLQGFYHPKGGNILINGVSTGELSFSDLRSAIAHVPQETFLFGGTFRENLAMACPNISEEGILAACQSACIHDFIMSLLDGYDTQIGERGVKLSGGQKQRLAIARALVRKPKILLLDDSTSALDVKTETALWDALEGEAATMLVVTQKIRTAQGADTILLLDEGKVVGYGTHDDLMEQSALYRKIAESQSEEEAASDATHNS